MNRLIFIMCLTIVPVRMAEIWLSAVRFKLNSMRLWVDKIYGKYKKKENQSLFCYHITQLIHSRTFSVQCLFLFMHAKNLWMKNENNNIKAIFFPGAKQSNFGKKKNINFFKEVFQYLWPDPLDRLLVHNGWLVGHFCRPKIWWNSTWLNYRMYRVAYLSSICTMEWPNHRLHWPVGEMG